MDKHNENDQKLTKNKVKQTCLCPNKLFKNKFIAK